MACSLSASARSTSALAASFTSFSAFATMTSASVSARSIVLLDSTSACSSTVLALMSCCSSSFFASSMSARAASEMSTAAWYPSGRSTLRRLRVRSVVWSCCARSARSVSSMLLATAARLVWNSRAVHPPHALRTEERDTEVTTLVYPSKSMNLRVRVRMSATLGRKRKSASMRIWIASLLLHERLKSFLWLVMGHLTREPKAGLVCSPSVSTASPSTDASLS
mmetsp:Transcript_1947/g.4911  ORF Transcript_1947/g.4911 Transcript_1947/m.4911 type:complete len:223 (-) Transcript_1947:2011-2679(-)